MKKLWIPLSYGVNDTQAMRELFERFAKKGWHFDKLYGTGVLFIKGEKQACAYAVDLFSLKRKNNDDEQLQEYYDFCAQSGWEFADGYDQYQVFKAAEGAEPIPLQSDDEVAFDILYQQRIREIGHNVYEALSTILLLFLVYCLFPLDFYTDDLFLMIGILTPVLGCLILLRQAFRYVKMRQVKKAVAQGEPYIFTNHLLSRSIRDFTVLLLCIGFLIKLIFFTLKGFGKEYAAGIKNGFSLCMKPENRSKKVHFKLQHLSSYIVIEWELFCNLFRFIFKL